jgi:hypothetical protein
MRWVTAARAALLLTSHSVANGRHSSPAANDRSTSSCCSAVNVKSIATPCLETGALDGGMKADVNVIDDDRPTSNRPS